MSTALQATKMAYDPHPSYAYARQEASVAAERVAAASEAVRAVAPHIEAVALLGHPGIDSLARDLYINMLSAPAAARMEDQAGIYRAVSDSRRGFADLRSAIRLELGVEEESAPPTPTNSD